MQATTIKRLAILTTVLTLIGGAVFAGHRQQVARLAKRVLDDAQLAEQKGDYNEAESLYRQDLEIFPGDTDVQIKYADAHVKAANTFSRRTESLQLYRDILKRDPERVNVRQRQLDLEIEMGDFAGARSDVATLLKNAVNTKDLKDVPRMLESSATNGRLLFLMGRCCEEAKDYTDAELYYREALKHGAPEPIDVYMRLAVLLRDRLKQEKQADKVIADMVLSESKNYKVYLVRGQYVLAQPDATKSTALLANAKSDFAKALELAPDKPEVYLEMAKVAERESGPKAAQQILEKGQEEASKSAMLYGALASILWRTEQFDKAVSTLESGLKAVPEDPQGQLRGMLANLLAQRKDAGKLLLQIEELKKIGYPPSLVQYLQANYYVITGNYIRARQLLAPLQSIVKRSPQLKASVNVLLAKCYSQLVEPELEHEAYVRALSANPQDVTARRGLIATLVNQGEFEAAIKEYRALLKQAPDVRLALAALLIQRNRQRPATRREWGEIENLISEAAKAAPGSVEPIVLLAETRVWQENFAQARNELEMAKTRFPKNPRIRAVYADVFGSSGRLDEALRVLDQAEQELGDHVELRLERAKLWSLGAIKKGPQLVAALSDLAKSTGTSFSKDDRRRLLRGLAGELLRQEDVAAASRLWTQLVELDPTNLELRLNLLDLAFQTADEAAIENTIKQIGEIEGKEGVLGRFCQVRYLIWKAQRSADKSKQLTWRTEARVLLNDLMGRRGDWSVIPLALAELEDQEMKQGGLTDDERRAKESNVASYYLQAVRLGQRGPAVVRRTVELLFKNKRGSEAIELLNSIPVASQLAGDVGRQAALFAVQTGDFQHAEEIASKAIAANPGDLQERLLLVRVLLASGRQTDAETKIREAVDYAKSEPDRWTALVMFMASTKQPEKAEKAVLEAEQYLPKAQGPLTLARCSELVGQAYSLANREDDAQKWFSETVKWYHKAQAAQPNNATVVRLLTEFYLRTKQTDEAQSELATILKQSGPDSKAGDNYAWARRTLALTYASGSTFDQAHKALALFEPDGQATPPGQEGKTLQDPEDLRILARVLEAQRNQLSLARAIEILESLITRSLANNEDRFLLARLYEKINDWPKAREAYRALDLLTKNARDLETLNRRPFYLAQFADAVLRNRRDAEDLREARELLNDLRQLQPESLPTLALRVELYRAQNQPDEAAKLIEAYASRPQLTPAALKTLASLAEKQQNLRLAEEVYQRLAKEPGATRGGIEFAEFLGRRQRIKEALNFCEGLWTNTREPEVLAAACVEIVFQNEHPDSVDLGRVSGWLEQALAKNALNHPKARPLLLIGLGNIKERQGQYEDAKANYARAIKEGDRDGISRNNLAWLMALKDGNGRAALNYINQAIELNGPRADYLDTRGIVYLSAGDVQLAIGDLKRAVELDPSATRYFHLAQAYYEIKDKEKARENFERARTKGLTRRDLHPLEQSAYDKLLGDVEKP
jgi:cellulose synthase operon protein C